jgi:hypothetical protein
MKSLSKKDMIAGKRAGYSPNYYSVSLVGNGADSVKAKLIVCKKTLRVVDIAL